MIVDWFLILSGKILVKRTMHAGLDKHCKVIDCLAFPKNRLPSGSKDYPRSCFSHSISSFDGVSEPRDQQQNKAKNKEKKMRNKKEKGGRSNEVQNRYGVFLKNFLHKREEKMQEKLKMTLQKDKNLA